MRREDRNPVNAGGYLTVYVALTMAVLVSLFLAVLEGTRQHTFRLEAELITDIGLDSILAEYHRELLEQYNLFFIDTTYGTTQTSLALTEDHLRKYLEMNCTVDDVLLGQLLYRDFLEMEVESVSIDRFALSTDEDGYYFRSRAVEAVKDDVGLSLLETVGEWFQTVEDNDLSVSDLAQEKEAVDGEISSYDGTQKLVEEEWVTIDVENPTKQLETWKGKGILNLVVENAGELSTAGVDLTGLISSRRTQGEINQGNWGESTEEGWVDRVLFQEYILRYCGNYVSPGEDRVLCYETEYVIAGKDNDVENLKSVVYRILAIREAANALYLFSDETKCAEAEAMASVLALAILSPELTDLFKATILLGWVSAESIYDVRCLLQGERIPLLKTSDTWNLSLEGALSGLLGDAISGQDAQNQDVTDGLCYEDYLRLLLLLSSLEDVTFRVMDVVEMNVRQTNGNQTFRMDACVDRLEAVISIHSAFGYDAVVTRSKSYY